MPRCRTLQKKKLFSNCDSDDKQDVGNIFAITRSQMQEYGISLVKELGNIISTKWARSLPVCLKAHIEMYDTQNVRKLLFRDGGQQFLLLIKNSIF